MNERVSHNPFSLVHEIDPQTKIVSRAGGAVGIEIDGVARAGFPTPSRKLEFYSTTLARWGFQPVNTALRMRYGPPVGHDPTRMFGLFNLFFG